MTNRNELNLDLLAAISFLNCKNWFEKNCYIPNHDTGNKAFEKYILIS